MCENLVKESNSFFEDPLPQKNVNDLIVLFNQQKFAEMLSNIEAWLLEYPKSARLYNAQGVIFRYTDRDDEALIALDKALEIEPRCYDAHFNKTLILYKRSILSGNAPEKAPSIYVERVFDGYADTFEKSLVKDLSYRTPKIIAEYIRDTTPEEKTLSILDMGCGTGLVGEEIKTHFHHIDGIDLSDNMLKKAADKNIYSSLEKIEILEFLQNNALDYDCFIAADVFVYIGDLEDIFDTIRKNNKRSGQLIFSTEHMEDGLYKAYPSLRYSHSRTYIENLCTEFGYHIAHASKHNLRKEKGEWLEGGFYVLDFDPV